MIITPAKFEDEYELIPKRGFDDWVDLTGAVILPPELWSLIRDTLTSLGYGATMKKMDEALK